MADTTVTISDAAGQSAHATAMTQIKTDVTALKNEAEAAAARAELATDASSIREILGLEGALVNEALMGNYVVLSHSANYAGDELTLDASNINGNIKFDLVNGADNPFKDIQHVGIRMVVVSAIGVSHDVNLSVSVSDGDGDSLISQTISSLKGSTNREQLIPLGRFWEFDAGDGTIKRHSATALEQFPIPTDGASMQITCTNAFTLAGNVVIQLWVVPGPLFGMEDHSYAVYATDASTNFGTSGAFITLSIALDNSIGANVLDDFTLSSDEVTISRTGVYRMRYDVGVEATVGTADDATVRIEEDTGLGFGELANTARTVSVDNASDAFGMVSTEVLVSVDSGDKFRLAGSMASTATVGVRSGSATLVIERKA